MTTSKSEALREGHPSEATEARAAAARLHEAAPALERVAAIDARLAAIASEAKAAARGPLPKDEVADRLISWLRSRRQEFEHPRSEANGDKRPFPVVVSQLSARDTVIHASADEAFTLLVWLLGPELEDRAREAVAGLDYVEGLSAAERVQRGAAHDKERARLVAEREPLVETVRAAGIAFAHLPETQDRLNNEARRAALRAEEQIRDQTDQRRQHEIEKEIEARESRA